MADSTKHNLNPAKSRLQKLREKKRGSLRLEIPNVEKWSENLNQNNNNANQTPENAGFSPQITVEKLKAQTDPSGAQHASHAELEKLRNKVKKQINLS